jgi:uncharacterized RDD family membrane protein YckC
VSEVAPGLAVDSVTGIDVSLPLAGAGARSYAFIVDWHIRLVLGLAWFVSGALLYNGRLSLNPPLTNEARWFGTVVAPALAIYFLYHYVLEVAMRGSTPGKRMAQVRLVTRDGGVPGIGPLLVRNVFRLVDSLPVFYGLGLTLVVLTPQRGCGDMAPARCWCTTGHPRRWRSTRRVGSVARWRRAVNWSRNAGAPDP